DPHAGAPLPAVLPAARAVGARVAPGGALGTRLPRAAAAPAAHAGRGHVRGHARPAGARERPGHAEGAQLRPSAGHVDNLSVVGQTFERSGGAVRPHRSVRARTPVRRRPRPGARAYAILALACALGTAGCGQAPGQADPDPLAAAGPHSSARREVEL